MPTLAIVLPVHNEKKSLESVIASWSCVLQKITNCNFTFLLCEDGSTDGTKELIQSLMPHYPIVNLSTEDRRGYGNAVLDGITAAKSDYILCIDSDGQCSVDNFLKFWECRDRADFVIGWRYPRQDPFVRLLYSKIFFILHKILFPCHLHDPSCPFVLGNRDAYHDITYYMGFLKEGFWWGFVGACVKRKKTLLEVKINHKKRYAGKTQVYQLKKMPKIIARNIIGLFKLRITKIHHDI